MTEQITNGTPQPEEHDESETTQIFRRAFAQLQEFGLDVTVTDHGDHTEVKGPDEPKDEPPTPPTQP